jgi:hypothetical protein
MSQSQSFHVVIVRDNGTRCVRRLLGDVAAITHYVARLYLHGADACTWQRIGDVVRVVNLETGAHAILTLS